MSSLLVRLGRYVLWLVGLCAVLAAITVTTLRIMLPQIDRFQPQIEGILSQNTGMSIDIGELRGFWRNAYPMLSLGDVVISQPQRGEDFILRQVTARFDIFESIRTQSFRLSTLDISGVEFDLRELAPPSITGNKDREPAKVSGSFETLENLFFYSLSDFSLTDSVIQFSGIDGTDQRLDISEVKWRNRAEHHQIQGILTTADVDAQNVEFMADFVSQKGLRDMSGDFYLQVREMQLSHVLAPFVSSEVQLNNAEASINAWLKLDNNRPISAHFDLLPSELTWSSAGSEHAIVLEKGALVLEPSGDGVRLSARDMLARTDSIEWPSFDFVVDRTTQRTTVNLSALSLEALLPIAALLPDSQRLQKSLIEFAPKGELTDIRVSMADGIDTLSYSASLSGGQIQQSGMLPGFSTLSAHLTGNAKSARAKLTLLDDVLPYGDMFQAPLNLRHGYADVVWQRDTNGWRLWSEKTTAATPDLQVLGEFLLDFPNDGAPFLSFYAEADLQNAGETWRYLPARALKQNLTNYLSSAIQGGKAQTAQLLWYGELSQFPYANNNGVFQAKVPLTDTKFSFSTDWPTITDMQLDLLFENSAMYLDSYDAQMMGVSAKRIQGVIPRMASGGHIEIKAAAVGNGRTVRDYMLATPLVDSVGAALTTIDIANTVDAEFELFIPFTPGEQARAWGSASLLGNDITIKTPAMNLQNAFGTIEFDNDVVKSNGLVAELLGQPIALDFVGENHESGYEVAIDVLGDWDAKPLGDYIGAHWVAPVDGHAPWHMDLDIQLNDIGFTYQLDTEVDLQFVDSRYPQPFTRHVGQKGKAVLQASGNQESVSARLQMPQFKFQSEIDISQARPVLQATNWVLGSGSFKVSPIVGHHAAVRMPEFDLDSWVSIFSQAPNDEVSALSEMQTPEVPLPLRVQLSTPNLKAAGIEWGDVEFLARKRPEQWSATLSSAQTDGTLTWHDNNKLEIALNRLNVFVPALETDEAETTDVLKLDEDKPLISDFDRSFFEMMPNATLQIGDFWLQGYKVGVVNVELNKRGNTLHWDRMDFISGESQLNMTGMWTLDGDTSHSSFSIEVESENNSDIMARFGIHNGIQRAPFSLDADLNWDGSPWGLKVDSLSGNVSSEMGQGVISGVGGAAKFLGLFSFDSLVRRLQLDFSDVFDEGLAFDSIKGTGKVENGVFLTNDLEMEAISGDMAIKGLVNLNTETIDAQATFKPDLTSGIPALTAFAITPQTALYVLAVTTVIAPVVEVITQVTYGVEGSLNDPIITEQSRQKGDFKIPKEYRR